MRVIATTACVVAAVLLSATLRGQSAVDQLLDAWDDHPIVAVAEGHRVIQPALFLRDVIAAPRFPDLVDDIVVEFATARLQSTLDRFVAGMAVPEAELRRVWGDTTVVNGLWDAPMYRELLEAVRDRNRSLPEQLRVIACDPPIDWSRGHVLADAAPYLDRTSHCAGVVEREVLAR